MMDHTKPTDIQGAIERLFSGDRTGHENCTPGNCEMANSFKEPYGPASHVYNALDRLTSGSTAGVAGIHVGLIFALADPGLAERILTAMETETGSPRAPCDFGDLPAVLDEHHPLENADVIP